MQMIEIFISDVGFTYIQRGGVLVNRQKCSQKLLPNKKESNMGHRYVAEPHDTHKYGDVTCGYLCRRNYTF